MRELLLDERKLESADAAHELLARELDFPSYYGANLSALSDCLEDLCEPVRIVCMQLPESDERSQWFANMARVIKRCSAENECLEFEMAVSSNASSVREDLPAGARECMERLAAGNERFVEALANDGDISPARVADLFENGQHPFATVICCADSRVVPEHIFMCGLGDIFTIRVAGNVIGTDEGASAVYACGHLHTQLLVLMGHTACGAVAAALEGGDHGSVNPLVECICANIGDERDPDKASIANVNAGLQQLRALPEIAELEASGELAVVGALYHADTGAVEFL